MVEGVLYSPLSTHLFHLSLILPQERPISLHHSAITTTAYQHLEHDALPDITKFCCDPTTTLAQIGSALRALAPIAPNTQSCSATVNVVFTTYNVQIGLDFANGVSCSTFQDNLEDQLISPTGFSCQDDGNGDTSIAVPVILAAETSWRN